MNLPIPVLHVINGCVDGSIARIIERIIRYSPKDEFEWHVCHVKGSRPFAEQFERLGVKVVDCSVNPAFSTPSSQKIKQYVVENNIRIVHSHTPRTILAVWNALHSPGSSIKSNVTHLATKHLLTSPKDRRFGLAFAIFDRFSFYLADHIVPVSHTMAKKIIALPGIKSSKVTAIPNAIPVEDYYHPEHRDNCRKEIGLSSQMLAIGFTGRITKVKSLDLLLSAFNAVFPLYPHARLILAGEGNLRPQLEEQARRLKINNAVIWLGFYSDIPRLLSALDIYVQPSVNEGLSLSILEAMAAERPVIVTRVGSAEEVIEDGRNGILINPGKESEIATAMLTMLSNSDMRNRLAKNGRGFVCKEYNIQKMVLGYCNLYQQLGKEREA